MHLKGKASWVPERLEVALICPLHVIWISFGTHFPCAACVMIRTVRTTSCCTDDYCVEKVVQPHAVAEGL